MFVLIKKLSVDHISKDKLVELLVNSTVNHGDYNSLKIKEENNRLKMSPFSPNISVNILFNGYIDYIEDDKSILVTIKYLGFAVFILYLSLCLSVFSVLSFFVFNLGKNFSEFFKYYLICAPIIQFVFFYIWFEFKSIELFEDIKKIILRA